MKNSFNPYVITGGIMTVTNMVIDSYLLMAFFQRTEIKKVMKKKY